MKYKVGDILLVKNVSPLPRLRPHPHPRLRPRPRPHLRLHPLLLLHPRLLLRLHPRPRLRPLPLPLPLPLPRRRLDNTLGIITEVEKHSDIFESGSTENDNGYVWYSQVDGQEYWFYENEAECEVLK